MELIKNSLLKKLIMTSLLLIIYIPGAFVKSIFFDFLFTFPLSCWLYGIYAFQGKLNAKGILTKNQFQDYDNHFFYYFGFGFLITLPGFVFSSFFVSYSLSTVLLAIMSIASVKSNPVDQKYIPPIPFTNLISVLVSQIK